MDRTMPDADAHETSPFEAGRGRADITVWEPGRVMMGWADPRNVARTRGEPLFARAVALRDVRTARSFVFVCVELAIVTDHLRDAVIERVRRRSDASETQVMIAATHNHSGPGGHAGYLWYDIPSGGFSPEVFATLADRIAEAASEALATRVPATLRWIEGETEIRRVATNRAVRAYNRNEGVVPVTAETAERAVDPRMQLLRIDTLDGQPFAAINWLGLHGTCFHGDGTTIRPDHKGVAAARFESEQAPGFVAIFAQGAAGDVTSNRRYDPERGVTVGPGRDDETSCAIVAGLEVESARRLFAAAATCPVETAPLRFVTERHSLAERAVAPHHAGGRADRRSTRPTIALGMALGTDEGPGPLHPARRAQRTLASARRAAHAVRARFGGDADGEVRIPMVEFGSGRRVRGFGFLPLGIPRLPDPLARRLGATAARICNVDPAHARFVPTEVDVQIVQLGRWAVIGIAAEPTTIAGRRLRSSVRAALADLGVRDVVVSGYTNGYCGYLATPEEHLEQGYEAGATIFGRYALPAYQTVLDAVASSLRRASIQPAADALGAGADASR